ncbi:hypothetical protein EG328_011469 [Venturia inaequalis]|uniref:ABC transporter TMD0 domain-containing protein n=1 Tax=Venturia inaequalis TaxID=5025 RepID=A0A8H3V406_VENIN|nr:hypothetical protein EG328_011469 [Venturia inaequalis]
MLTLCNNRPEGLGPHSRKFSDITTSCFNDAILVPFSVWLYILLLPILFATQPRVTTFLYTGKVKRPYHNLKIALYALALFAALAMTVIEITRLELADLGIGLLPAEWAGFIIAGALRFSHGIEGRFPRYWIANVVFWVLLIATNAVRLVEMIKEGLGARRGTAYPMSDQVTDVGVYIGVYFVMGMLELWR